MSTAKKKVTYKDSSAGFELFLWAFQKSRLVQQASNRHAKLAVLVVLYFFFPCNSFLRRVHPLQVDGP